MGLPGLGHGQHCEVLSCPSCPRLLPSGRPTLMSPVHSLLPLLSGLSGEVTRAQGLPKGITLSSSKIKDGVKGLVFRGQNSSFI